jgi:hypothetical protein
MRYLCRISYEDDAYTLQDILIGYLESFPAGYPLGYLAGYPVCYRQIRLGTRCSPVALHPAYRSRLRPRFCTLNEAGGFCTMCVYSALPGPGPPGAARTGPAAPVARGPRGPAAPNGQMAQDDACKRGVGGGWGRG